MLINIDTEKESDLNYLVNLLRTKINIPNQDIDKMIADYVAQNGNKFTIDVDALIKSHNLVTTKDLTDAISKATVIDYDIAAETAVKNLPLGDYVVSVIQAGNSPVVEWKDLHDVLSDDLISHSLFRDLVTAISLGTGDYDNYKDDIATAPTNMELAEYLADIINDETRPIKASLIKPASKADVTTGTPYWLSRGLQGTVEVITIAISQLNNCLRVMQVSGEDKDNFQTWKQWMADNFTINQDGIFQLKDFTIKQNKDGSYFIEYTYPGEPPQQTGELADTLDELNINLIRHFRDFENSILPEDPELEDPADYVHFKDQFEFI